MLESFRPLLNAARGVDLTDPTKARQSLTERFDPSAPAAGMLAKDLIALLDAGQLAQRGELPVRYGRVCKASPESDDFSIDVVHMNGAGPLHVHPAGEVNYLIPLEGSPRFEGASYGWVVMPPGSSHVPAVEGGRMLIVYLLPGGKIAFKA
jgi:hypothetical protein